MCRVNATPIKPNFAVFLQISSVITDFSSLVSPFLRPSFTTLETLKTRFSRSALYSRLSQ